jgi:hypothetical protein
MQSDARWKLPLLVAVVAAHLWLGWKLALYRPAYRPDKTVARASTSESEFITVLTFPDPSPKRLPARVRRRPTVSTGTQPRPGVSSPAAIGSASEQIASGATLALDLHPRLEENPRFAAPDPLRHREVLAFERTRFDGAWLSDGNIEEVAARKSAIAAAVLGALGALRKPCTERQREQYDVACVPDQYHHPGPGE